MEDGDGLVLCFPDFPNTSCWKPSFTWARTLFIYISLYSISVLTTVLNLLIIISVSHFRQLHTPTNILLLSLAVSDFLVGLLLMPLQFLRITHCWMFGIIGCSFYRYTGDVIFCVSVIDVAFISVDRYVAICDPLHYKSRITVNRVNVCVCLSWFWSVVYNTYFLLAHLVQQMFFPTCFGDCDRLLHHSGTITDIVFHFFFPVSVIIVLYTRVFVVAVSQARAMRSHITAVTKQISVNKKANKSELKAARTLGVLVVVFLMCFVPPYSISFSGLDLRRVSDLNFIAFLYYINSFLNPVIYALFYPWFRKAVKLIVTLQILRPGSCEANIL